MNAAREFIVGARRQEEWGWTVIIDMFLTGAGSGLFFIGLMVSSFNHMVVGMAAVLIGAVILSAHLMHPLHSWRVFLRPATSWISRGAIGMTSFLILGVAYVVALTAKTGTIYFVGPWPSGPPWMVILGAAAGLSALFVSLYPGFLLNSMRSVSLWRNGLFPVLFSISGLLCGLGLYYLVPPSVEPGVSGKLFILYFSVGLILLGFLLLFALVLVKPGAVTGRNNSTGLPLVRFKAYIFAIFVTEIIIPFIAVYMLLRGAVYPMLVFVAGVSLAGSSLLIRLFVLRYGHRTSPV